jgi:predicted nuclease of predicted toxin-antitoxin system
LKILLDENLPHKLRECLTEYEVVTAVYAGFGGFKNGALLKAAEYAGFDVLVSGDLSLEYQQNLKERKIAIVSLSANNWQIVRNNVPAISAAIRTSTPGSFTRVECIGPRRIGQTMRPEPS